MHDHVLHLGIVDRALRVAAPGLLRLGVVGEHPDYAEAEEAWRSHAQRTVDDAEMKYVIVHLHRLLEPELPKAG